MGGFVAWHMGTRSDGADSLAEQIMPAEHWPEMRILVLVVRTTQVLINFVPFEINTHCEYMLKG